MSERRAKNPNDLSLKEIAIYIGVVALMAIGIAMNVAPTGILSGLGAGLIVAIHFFTRSRQRPPDSK